MSYNISTNKASSQVRHTYETKTTMPDIVLRHDISDDELDKLDGSQISNFNQSKWAGIGLIVGTLSSVVCAFVEFFQKNQNFRLNDVLQVAIFSIGASMAIICGLISSKKGNEVSRLKKEIRNRKVKLG